VKCTQQPDQLGETSRYEEEAGRAGAMTFTEMIPFVPIPLVVTVTSLVALWKFMFWILDR
jgi:hypothetical protein